MAAVDKGIEGRLFIVGSARSGTTLLQAMMAKNSDVFTFPESHFFCRTIRNGRRRRWFGIADVAAATRALDDLRKLVGQSDAPAAGRRWDPRIKKFASVFSRIIDDAALVGGFPVWLEKTPHHIDYVGEISEFVRGAKFVHILRDGRDAVASQFAAQQQDPAYWRPWSIEQMAKSWGRDVSISLNHFGQPDHFFVFYDDLIANAERTLNTICEFAGLKYESQMLRHWEAADTVLGNRKQEPWMQNIYQPITKTHLVKFNALFSVEQQESVITNLIHGGDIHTAFMALGYKRSVSSST